MAPRVDGNPRRLSFERSPPISSSSSPFSSRTRSKGTIPVLRLDVGLPQVRRLEDVAVCIDGTIEGQPLCLVQGLGHPFILLDLKPIAFLNARGGIYPEHERTRRSP